MYVVANDEESQRHASVRVSPALAANCGEEEPDGSKPRTATINFKPREFLGESVGASRGSAVTLSLGQVVTFHEAGVDGVAHG